LLDHSSPVLPPEETSAQSSIDSCTISRRLAKVILQHASHGGLNWKISSMNLSRAAGYAGLNGLKTITHHFGGGTGEFFVTRHIH
jgi:hypothetical protein